MNATNPNFLSHKDLVVSAVENAFTRTEYEAAQALLSSYYDRYPEEVARDLGHGLARTRIFIEEREAQVQPLGLSYDQIA